MAATRARGFDRGRLNWPGRRLQRIVKDPSASRARVELDPCIAPRAHPGVYSPSEDTALLLSALVVRPEERVLEVGVGGGLVSLHAARVAWAAASDVSASAVRLAAQNAADLHLQLHVVRCDLMSAFRGPFDVVAFNPPYLEGEPTDSAERAWAGGEAGNRVALRFLLDLPRVLAPKGRAYLLLSEHDAAARAVAPSRFSVKVLASRRLFFERLDVLELRPLPA